MKPASTYAYRVQRRHGHVAVFNLEPSDRDETATSVFPGKCEETLVKVLPELAD